MKNVLLSDDELNYLCDLISENLEAIEPESSEIIQEQIEMAHLLLDKLST